MRTAIGVFPILLVSALGCADSGSVRVLQAGLPSPQGVAIGPGGEPLVSVAGKLGRAGDGAILRWNGERLTPLVSGLDDPGPLASWGGVVFVADGRRIWRVSGKGERTEIMPATALPATFERMIDLTIDERGVIYAVAVGSEPGAGAVFRVSPKGQIERVNVGSIPSPRAAVMDGMSHLLIADADGVHRLRLSDAAVTKVVPGAFTRMAWDWRGRLYLAAADGRIVIRPRPGTAPVARPESIEDLRSLCVSADGSAVFAVDGQSGAIVAVPPDVPGQPLDESPLPIATQIAYPNLEWAGWQRTDKAGNPVPLRPILLTHAGDGSGRVFVPTQHGVIHVFPNDDRAERTRVFLDLQHKVRYDDRTNEEGFLGLAFHPRYKENGEFFVFYTDRNAKLTNVVSRFRVSRDDPNRADPASEEELLRIAHRFWNHDGGTICFGPDGYLYIAVGDGGSADDPDDNGQNLGTILGKVLRIDVDRPSNGRPYSIPSDNPFANRTGARPEIFAYGLRNVWRMAFDRGTGRLWAADVGQNLYEEINLLERGGNYGWNLREALHPFGRRGVGSRRDLLDPIWEYHHDIGKSITGGAVYRGSQLPELAGAYVYGDYVSTRIWALWYDERLGRVVANRPIRSPGKPILSFGEDDRGELYFMTDTPTGQGIYRFVRSGASR